MANIFLLATLIFALDVAPPAGSSTHAWNFFGFLAEAEVGCVNKMTTRSGYVWIRRDADRRPHYDQLKAQFNREYPGHTMHSVYDLRPGEPRAIARVEAVYECATSNGTKRVTIHKFFDGADRDAATEAIERWRRGQGDRVKGWTVVEWIDAAERVEALNRQTSPTVIGRHVS